MPSMARPPPRSAEMSIIIIIIIIMSLKPLVRPWPLFQFLEPIHSR
jgi:hypothetical protein